VRRYIVEGYEGVLYSIRKGCVGMWIHSGPILTLWGSIVCCGAHEP